jgi:hypothetical protein
VSLRSFAEVACILVFGAAACKDDNGPPANSTCVFVSEAGVGGGAGKNMTTPAFDAGTVRVPECQTAAGGSSIAFPPPIITPGTGNGGAAGASGAAGESGAGGTTVPEGESGSTSNNVRSTTRTHS